MRQLFIKNATKNFFLYTYLSTLFLSFHYFFITYINSTVLSEFVTDKNLGILYILGSILTLIFFLYISQILKNLGNYKAMLYFLVIEIAATLGLAFFQSVPLVILAFVIHHAAYPMLVLSLDIFIEHYSKNENTGKIRGLYLTIMHISAVFSPFIVGIIFARTGYRPVYLVSALFTIALFILVRAKFKNFRDSEYHMTKGLTVLTKFLRHKSIRQIYVTSLMLQIFYSWLIIYVPIYLFEYLHFTWPQIGLAISISLLPFVLFDIPLGALADQKIGEKEILFAGFIIMIGALIIMGETLNQSFPFWVALLTLARTGASFVDVGSDTYFFKQINRQNDELMSFWRTTNPIGYIIGTIAGSVSLIIMPFNSVFFVLAVILIIGLVYSAKLKDTL